MEKIKRKTWKRTLMTMGNQRDEKRHESLTQDFFILKYPLVNSIDFPLISSLPSNSLGFTYAIPSIHHFFKFHTPHLHSCFFSRRNS